jgi:hypothetical protein
MKLEVLLKSKNQLTLAYNWYWDRFSLGMKLVLPKVATRHIDTRLILHHVAISEVFLWGWITSCHTNMVSF